MEKVHISQEQINELLAKIQEHKKKPGPLMPTLNDAQRIIGFIPYEIQELISNELKVPVARIFGVVTFYAQFSTMPKGKNHIAICMGTACYVKGAQAILDRIGSDLKVKDGETTDDGEYTVETTRCVGACGLAPVMIINEDTYGKLTVSKAAEAVDEHKGVEGDA